MKRHPSGIDPFQLFCAYHLGLARDGQVGIRNVHQVAKQFAVGAHVIREALSAYEMDPDQVLNSGFDVAIAQADVAVAPDGDARQELAREAYQRFREADPRGRDWSRELADDEASLADDPMYGGGKR